MKYFITKNKNNEIEIVGAFGWIPENNLGEAPEGAEPSDAHAIEEVEPGKFVLNFAKKEQKRIEKEQEKDREKNKYNKKVEAAAVLKSLKRNDIKPQDIPDILMRFKEYLLGE